METKCRIISFNNNQYRRIFSRIHSQFAVIPIKISSIQSNNVFPIDTILCVVNKYTSYRRLVIDVLGWLLNMRTRHPKRRKFRQGFAGAAAVAAHLQHVMQCGKWKPHWVHIYLCVCVCLCVYHAIIFNAFVDCEITCITSLGFHRHQGIVIVIW